MSPESLIEAFGMLGLFLIVFAESGLLIGFFLPGDSLLFTAGLLAYRGVLNLPVVVVVAVVAAVAGDQAGYFIGRKAGPALFTRPNSRFFRQRNLERAHAYFEKGGPRTVVIARFLPVIRTFTPLVAGVARMRYRRFVAFNVVGGTLWGAGMPVLGYILGRTIPDLGAWLLPVVLVIGACSFVPVGLEVLKLRRDGEADRLVVAQQPEGHE
ncbi:MAG: VTT domain-containing protein [Actinomycetota bacterium]|nr:VTT domain-containing protein [Actinomycetota bacterium]